MDPPGRKPTPPRDDAAGPTSADATWPKVDRRAPGIQRADAAARRAALVALIVVVALGGVTIPALRGHLDAVAVEHVDAPAEALGEMAFTLRLVAIGIALPLFGAAAWAGQLARRVISTRRFPPPGMRVVRNTRIVTGARALVYARAAILLTVAFLAAGTVGLAIILRLTDVLGAG